MHLICCSFMANKRQTSQDQEETCSLPRLRVHKKPKEAFPRRPQPIPPLAPSSSCECTQPGLSGLGSGTKRSGGSDKSMKGTKRRRFNADDVAVATAEALLATAPLTNSLNGFLSMLRDLLETVHPDMRLAIQIKILSLIKTKLPKDDA
ncbi:uncharacterized protein LOC107044418 isoform X2 [Diachasma alloeum]|uniref:uncharacterized protein LOC107044418 isoform X2 n=1 Tax=Diachasma alloeum TaxID=454923 RepID=UPI0007382880|nr:uncharacterized protein LOC107044418 isoform X2 [Diachasma alloeum]